jgi:drug/metabolite transporter (DMT)-like permease
MPPAAVLLALSSIALWSFLAYLGARLSHVPPFLVVGIALCIGGTVGAARARSWRVPRKTLLVGVGGLFGYHFLYFTAFRYAPAVEANLINYLWPLLIVLLTPLLLPGNPLRPHNLVGALLGLAGAALIITGGRLSLETESLGGYLLMAGAALTWACYSLLTKRLPPFPTSAVGAFCLCSGLLSLGFYGLQLHSLPLAPALSAQEWALLLALGLGPMGAAFYTWDAALKRGDPRIIGSLAYLIPLTSTLVLVVLGGRSLEPIAGAAMILIVAGSVVGSLDVFGPRRKPAGLPGRGKATHTGA